MIGYRINGAAVGDSWKEIEVWFNGNGERQILPEKVTQGFFVKISDNRFVADVTRSNVLFPYSCMVLYKE